MSTQPKSIHIPSSGLTTRIALLAMLSIRPMHGYELRQAMETRHMHTWANVQYGSIYRGLQQLAREGLLAEDGAEREGNRPPRTIYRITDTGRAELLALLRQAWTEPTLSAEPVDLALSLRLLMEEDEIAELLARRLVELDALQTALDEHKAHFTAMSAERTAAFRAVSEDLFLHRQRLLDTERDWTQHVLTRLKSGAYHVTDEEREAHLGKRCKSPLDTTG